MNMDKTCTVINKSSGVVAYTVPDLNVRRQYAAHEAKKNISVRELEQLYQQPGGDILIYNYLMIDDPEIVDYLFNGSIVPEYWLKENDIPNFMNTCSLDEFKDALDFAPEGTKDIIKKLAVDMPLTDMSKCQAIKDQLGFDVMKAIELTKDPQKEAEKKKPAAAASGRRTSSSIAAPKVETTKIVVTTSKETDKKED